MDIPESRQSKRVNLKYVWKRVRRPVICSSHLSVAGSQSDFIVQTETNVLAEVWRK
jgi:hypothetical protein